MDTLEALEQCQAISGRIQRTEEYIRSIDDDLSSVRGLKRAIPLLAKMKKVTREKEAEIAELKKQRQAIIDMLERLPDARHSRILIAHYVHGQTWERIAQAENIGLRYMYRLRQAALEGLTSGKFMIDDLDSK